LAAALNATNGSAYNPEYGRGAKDTIERAQKGTEFGSHPDPAAARAKGRRIEGPQVAYYSTDASKVTLSVADFWALTS
jgi:hypothetical protein